MEAGSRQLRKLQRWVVTDVEKYLYIPKNANAAINHFAKITSKICWKKEASAQTVRLNLINQRVKILLEMHSQRGE